MNQLYTLIIDFDGGTYVVQSSSSGFEIAPKDCIEAWKTNEIEKIISKEDKQSILNQLKEEKFTPLENMDNVWCASVLVKGKLALMNLVLTHNGS